MEKTYEVKGMTCVICKANVEKALNKNVTKGRGVTIHRADCPNILNEQDEMRLIEVEWDEVDDTTQSYLANLEIFGYNRSGLLNEVLQTLNSQSKNLNNVNGRVDHNKMANIYVTVGVRNAQHLERIIDSLKNIPDVYEVKRAKG